jgi:hypothetical protein
MNTYLEEQLVRARLGEARATAARIARVRSLRPVRPPVRVRAGLMMIRAGRWLAHSASKPTAEPGRVAA